MQKNTLSKCSEILSANQDSLLSEWVQCQLAELGPKSEFITEQSLRATCKEFLRTFIDASSDSIDISDPTWDRLKALLADFSASRAVQGFSPSETATFVFSLKEAVFNRLRDSIRDSRELTEEIWRTTILLDKLGLFTTECFQRSREQVIKRQQQELLELSTPVIKLWDQVLAIPIIGTLDSQRTQMVMENLLTQIVATGSKLAILDITGVPTVDTQTAQHLIKTVSATRLMGADCIISGIRPQIAQTIVHLGIDISDITTKASMADAVAEALYRLGYTITRDA
jgi:rsbT co-antagonist protein RsbR